MAASDLDISPQNAWAFCFRFYFQLFSTFFACYRQIYIRAITYFIYFCMDFRKRNSEFQEMEKTKENNATRRLSLPFVSFSFFLVVWKIHTENTREENIHVRSKNSTMLNWRASCYPNRYLGASTGSNSSVTLLRKSQTPPLLHTHTHRDRHPLRSVWVPTKKPAKGSKTMSKISNRKQSTIRNS